jgi:deazaflavin-dependent oxidoreductase (nitroreductase family)
MSSPTDNVHDWNRKTIEEFRANSGKVGGNFAGVPLLLLHTLGARSGKERVNPMMYRDLGDRCVAIFASKAGAPTHPDWYHNLVANVCVTAEIGTETRRFRARTATSRERESIWAGRPCDCMAGGKRRRCSQAGPAHCGCGPEGPPRPCHGGAR